MTNSFVTVIFPLALPKLYTYVVPEALKYEIMVGLRVEVSLKNKLYSAIIAEVHEDLVLEYKPKPIIAILDKVPLVTDDQLTLWRWMADYYCCTIGEVMNVAMPAGLKLESETKVVFNGDFQDQTQSLSDDEYMIAEAVSIQNELTILQIQSILNKKTIFPVLRSLLDKNVISIKEELIEKFKPKMVNFMTLNEPYKSEPNLINEAFDMVIKSEKQTKTLLAFIQLSRNKNYTAPVADICQLAGVDSSVVQALTKKNIFTITKQKQSRVKEIGLDDTDKESLQSLSDQQIDALIEIKNYFEQHKPVLLHGITGSGKTRVYAELIKDTLAVDKQTLYLLPEIALTTHMVERLKIIFGNDVLVYHSRMNNQERVEMWNAVLLGAKIVIAARSGLFLPFVHLGLIIVDEEHDASFKQNDPNPRYNARDAAIYMANTTHCNIILGSATPSLESFANTINEKYGLVRMFDRHGESVLPKIRIVDLNEASKDKRFKGVFSPELITSIEEALINKEQILLFQNRRGYAPTINCHVCGWKADCINCDVHMTVHKAFNELRCHYCGTRSKIPVQCPACGNHDLFEQGFGTEKIEEEIKECFPTALVARLDMDTAKTKLAFENIIHDFEEQRIDILVGTQMISKGLDFGNIALVGVLNADAILRYPDLRANERAFQLLTQVSGRAGRRTKQGQVIIQTYNPTHPVIIETMHHLYDRFFERESSERKTFVYPPYFRMIQIELLHKNAGTCAHAAGVFADQVRSKIGSRLIGPAIPSIARIRGMYIQTITIKMEKDPKIVSKIKKIILQERDKLKQIATCKSVRVNIDVDPY
ncbi:MAG: primosomal protein N' [Saprospiraceae bacterium]|nr:primosomal protein N' [Saprospiraceae bacterium]